MIQSDWFTSQTHDHQALQLGQLKTLAKPFYDQLNAMGLRTQGILSYTSIYPWPDRSDQDLSPVTLGQLNFVFTLPVADSDHDGLPDFWERNFGLNPNDPADAHLDTDYDFVSNLEEFLMLSHPTERRFTITIQQPAENAVLLLD